MTLSIYKQKKVEELKRKAVALYKQGLTLREVARAIGKSRTWVHEAVKELKADRT